MTTIVLTSKKNLVWSSMQEIIPFVCLSWTKTQDEKHQVYAFDVDEESFAEKKEIFLKAEQIVLSCFTPNVARIATFLRFELSLNVRFLIHVHNQASIAFWPFRHWGHADLFQQHDIFISSCSRDADCIRKTYPTAQVEIVPFSYSWIDENTIPKLTLTEQINLMFIGRLSSQKNLHTLLLSLHLLKKKQKNINWHFTFIGSADHLGSPNMGFKDDHYDTYLKKLTIDLKLDDQVTFLGQLQRDEIDQILSRQKIIFVSPSLHSDENFGMAAFRALIGGHNAVLSDWGGHADFKSKFSDQVTLVKVNSGPAIDPAQLLDGLYSSLLSYQKDNTKSIDPYYLMPNIVNKCKMLIVTEWNSEKTLLTSSVADLILERAKKSVLLGQQKIFDSYSDPLKTDFFVSYGMTDMHSEAKNSTLVPWAIENQNSYIVFDPHRGHQNLEKNLESRKWLIQQGYFYEN